VYGSYFVFYGGRNAGFAYPVQSHEYPQALWCIEDGEFDAVEARELVDIGTVRLAVVWPAASSGPRVVVISELLWSITEYNVGEIRQEARFPRPGLT
jgi:hypothetical protein